MTTADLLALAAPWPYRLVWPEHGLDLAVVLVGVSRDDDGVPQELHFETGEVIGGPFDGLTMEAMDG